VLQQSGTSTFAARIEKILERVEYRRADTQDEKEAIFRLRYEAYAREGTIPADPSGLFFDSGDETANAWLIGVYIDGVLASSIRLHIASRPDHWLSATEAFPDLIEPKLEEGFVILDATRQTSRLEYTRAYPFLPLLTMRCGFVAMEHFDVDLLTGSCRVEYQAAFRRMFGSVTWGRPRPYPMLSRLHVLMAYDCKAKWADTRVRYPFLTSTPEERRALFGRSSNAPCDLHAELTAGRSDNLGQGKQRSATCAA